MYLLVRIFNSIISDSTRFDAVPTAPRYSRGPVEPVSPGPAIPPQPDGGASHVPLGDTWSHLNSKPKIGANAFSLSTTKRD